MAANPLDPRHNRRETTTYYDSRGRPVAYTQDGKHIYLFNGRPVGYFHNGSVYSFAGIHLGRVANGLIRDQNGDVALFTHGASGGPLKPLKHLKPLKSIKQLKPLKGIRELRPIRPLNSFSWSENS